MPRLTKTPENATVMMPNPPAWEPHPDGAGGLRPINENYRGDVSEPCPHCGAPLARDASNAMLARSFFKCPACKEPSEGAEVTKSRERNTSA